MNLLLNHFILKHATELISNLSRFNAPSDVLTHTYFYKNKKIGKTERETISEIAFTYLRYAVLIQSFFEEETGINAKIPGSEPKATEHAKASTLISIMLKTSLSITALKEKDLMNEEEASILAKFKEYRSKENSFSLQTLLPQWLIDEMLKEFSEEDIFAFSRVILLEAPLTLRVNTLKMKREDAFKELQKIDEKAYITEHSPWGIVLPSKPHIQSHPLFKDGVLEIQDEGSQLLALLTDAKPSKLVVDFCAGAGGKTLAMGQMMRNKGRIYAYDIDQKRLSQMSPRLTRSGITLVTPSLLDSLHDAKLKRIEGKVDVVLVDAPCSGMGTLRRNPDLKFRQNKESLNRLLQTQKEIINKASELVAVGGYLVYATCSLLREENEDQIEEFLKTHPHFEVEDLKEFYDKVKLQAYKERYQYFKLDPKQKEMDLFFACRLKRVR